MAHGDPDRNRTDIRSDRRPIPQKHHSARGDAPRNSGNFTRGSQLLNTQVLMWTQGARIPIYMWLGVFVLAYLIILSITLDENNIQLICMRVLSAIWNWIALDNLKQVDLRMPDGSLHRTIMGYVPYVPDVAKAWTKAVRGVVGSGMIATCVTIPLAIWYFDFSSRRGKAIIEEHHERGAMLVERDILYQEIVAHNKNEFLKDVQTLLPGKRPEDVIKMPFAKRKAAGIHHPYTLAGIHFPHRLEQSHVIVSGTTGSGKTTAFRKLLTEMRQRQDTAVVFDLTGAYVEAFYDPKRDTILNSMDARCPAWSIFNDCRTYSEFTAAASALIPSDGGSGDQFWVIAARTLFIEMAMKLVEKNMMSNEALADNLMTADLKTVHKHLKDTIADPLTAPEAVKMAESIRAVFNTNAQALRFLHDDGPAFSIKDWITREKLPGSILFITSSYTDLEMNRMLLTLWSNLAIDSLMTMKKTRSLRTWFVFDELGALHRLPAIERGLQTARNFGGAMVLGLHSFDKLIQVYGPENARNLSSLARTKLILAAANHETAEECSKNIGNREVRQMDEGYSYGYDNTRDASTLTARTQVEPLVIPDDITNLPSLEGFIKFPDGFPAARIKLIWEHYPEVAEGFIPRQPRKPDDPDMALRGSKRPKNGGDDGSNGAQALGFIDGEIEKDEALDQAENILYQSSTAKVIPSGIVGDAAQSPRDAVSPQDNARILSDEKEDRERSDNALPIRNVAKPIKPVSPTEGVQKVEDLAIREARDSFGHDGGMGI